MSRLLPILLLPLLAACVSAPPTDRANALVTLPDAFPASESGIDAAQACHTLGFDALPELNATLASDNFTLRAAAARLARADALARQAAGGLWPQVGASVGGTRGSSSAARAGFNIPGSSSVEEQFSAGLSASYEADVWGTVRAGRDAARYSAQAEAAALRDTRLALSASLALNLASLAAQRELDALLQVQLDTSSRFLELTELRFAQGQGAARDIGRQRQQLESLRGQQADLDGRIATVQAELDNLLGALDATAGTQAPQKLPQLPPLADSGLPADLAQQRPDVRQAWWRLAAADRALAVELNNRLPGVRLTASLSSLENQLDDLFRDALWSLGVEVGQTIFAGGRLAAARDAARADSDIALYSYAQTLLQALTEVRSTLLRNETQTRFLASVERQIVEAERVLELTRDAYRGGSTDFLNVLTALQSLQGLQQQRVNAALGQFSNRIALCRAIGQPPGAMVEPVAATARSTQ